MATLKEALIQDNMDPDALDKLSMSTDDTIKCAKPIESTLNSFYWGRQFKASAAGENIYFTNLMTDISYAPLWQGFKDHSVAANHDATGIISPTVKDSDLLMGDEEPHGAVATGAIAYAGTTVFTSNKSIFGVTLKMEMGIIPTDNVIYSIYHGTNNTGRELYQQGLSGHTHAIGDVETWWFDHPEEIRDGTTVFAECIVHHEDGTSEPLMVTQSANGQHWLQSHIREWTDKAVATVDQIPIGSMTYKGGITIADFILLDSANAGDTYKILDTGDLLGTNLPLPGATVIFRATIASLVTASDIDIFTSDDTQKAITDEDGDTALIVEANPDEDIIRGYVKGVERIHVSEGTASIKSNNLTSKVELTDISIGLDVASVQRVRADTTNTFMQSPTGACSLSVNNTTVVIKGNIEPETTSTTSIGSATKRIEDIYMSGRVHAFNDYWVEDANRSRIGFGGTSTVLFAPDGVNYVDVSNARIGFKGHIIPTVPNLYDLGTDTARFRDLYLSRNLNVDATFGIVDPTRARLNVSAIETQAISPDGQVELSVRNTGIMANGKGVGVSVTGASMFGSYNANKSVHWKNPKTGTDYSLTINAGGELNLTLGDTPTMAPVGHFEHKALANSDGATVTWSDYTSESIPMQASLWASKNGWSTGSANPLGLTGPYECFRGFYGNEYCSIKIEMDSRGTGNHSWSIVTTWI